MIANYLLRLVAMVPPPDSPFEAGVAADFRRVEAELGLELPDDYKQLVQKYGSGQWQQFWYVLNPFSANEYTNLLVQCQNRRPKKWSMLDAERGVCEAEGGRYPHPIYPEAGGILPWAATDNGGRFFWLTAGKPNTWSTVYYSDRSPDFQVFEVSCTELLLGAVSGTVPIFKGPFDEDFEYGQADAFVPSKPKHKHKNT
jgi:SMI1-KNR4 cell-wall